MQKQSSNGGKPYKIADFLNTMNIFCRIVILCSFTVTLVELIAVYFTVRQEILCGGIPLEVVYIPVIKQILTFATLSFFFAFLFDCAARKEGI